MKKISFIFSLVVCLGIFSGCNPRKDVDGLSAKASAEQESGGTSDGVGKVVPATTASKMKPSLPQTAAPVASPTPSTPSKAP